MSSYANEPRRQAPFPDSPPHTPSDSKHSSLEKVRTTGIFTSLGGMPPLTPDTSPRPAHSPPSPTLLTPADLPVGADPIGLGIGLHGYERKFPLSAAEEEKALAMEERTSRASTPSRFSVPGRLSRREKPQSMVTTFSYLMRVPRRNRPVLLLLTSLAVFALILISRSLSAVGEAERVDFMVRQAERGYAGRRYVETGSSGLKPVNINNNAAQAQAMHQKSRPSHRTIKSEPITLTPEDELLALIDFITSSTGNSLPPNVDPSVPVDPAVLLGFDPADPSAADDLVLLKEEVNLQYPLVLMGRMRDPWHIELNRLLDNYKIMPAPLIIDIDQREDHAQFIPVVQRLLGTEAFPQLLLQGKPLGAAQDIAGLEMEDLKALITANDAVAMRELTKKERRGSGHGKDGKIKAERERLLRPERINVY